MRSVEQTLRRLVQAAPHAALLVLLEDGEAVERNRFADVLLEGIDFQFRSLYISLDSDGESVTRDLLLREPDGTVRSRIDVSCHRIGRWALVWLTDSESEHVASVQREMTWVGQPELYYMPVVDLETGAAAGAEALIRLNHPERGLLTPDEFLVGVESIVGPTALGLWVIDEAIRQVAIWQRHFDMTFYRIGVNLSPVQFDRSDVADDVMASLERHKVNPEHLLVELIESVELTNRSRAAAQIRRLSDAGVRVAIDDFGTGFANLSYLNDLAVDMVKVDRTFLSPEPTRRQKGLLKAAVGFGDAIGADVLLEGLETKWQVDAALEAGVLYGQGKLFGMPSPADDGALPLPAMRSASASGQRPDVIELIPTQGGLAGQANPAGRANPAAGGDPSQA